MDTLLLMTMFIGTLQVTSYRSVPNQTDASPHLTATGERTNVHGIAVSQDLLKKNGGPLNYGDLVFVEGVGFKHVNDCMNERHKQRADVWVASLEDEQAFHKRYKNKKLRMWVIYPIRSSYTDRAGFKALTASEPTGLEPATSAVTVRRSSQLSYGSKKKPRQSIGELPLRD